MTCISNIPKSAARFLTISRDCKRRLFRADFFTSPTPRILVSRPAALQKSQNQRMRWVHACDCGRAAIMRSSTTKFLWSTLSCTHIPTRLSPAVRSACVLWLLRSQAQAQVEIRLSGLRGNNLLDVWELCLAISCRLILIFTHGTQRQYLSPCRIAPKERCVDNELAPSSSRWKGAGYRISA